MFSCSQALFEQAQTHIPGGVNSPVRAFRHVGGTPVFFKKAKGAYAWDEDNNKFIDYVGVAMDYDEPAQLRAFASQRKLPYMIVHDSNQQIARGFGNVYVTPTNILLNAQGEIVWKGVGAPDFAALSQRVKTMLVK